MAENTEFKWARHLNTILLTIMSIILIYVGSTMRSLTISQQNMRIEVAIIGKAVIDHNEESLYWKDKIETNENDIQDIQLGNISATSDRYTKTEALEALEDLKSYVERYYARK